jgi:multidrug resistance efflux pump
MGITELASETGGVILKLLVKEGEYVTKGQPLLQFDNSVQNSLGQEARARLKTQQQQLELDRIRINEALINLKKAELDYERTRRLVEKKAETVQQLDDARTELDKKKLALKNAESEIRLTEKRVSEFNMQIKTSNASEEKLIIRAPVNGRLLDLSARVGAGLVPGQRFAQLAPEGKLTALCEIDELFADDIQSGQAAFIRYKGYPDTISKGLVIYAAPYLKKKSLFSDEVGVKEDRRVREVRILLDNQALLINRQVDCTISIK